MLFGAIMLIRAASKVLYSSLLYGENCLSLCLIEDEHIWITLYLTLTLIISICNTICRTFSDYGRRSKG